MAATLMALHVAANTEGFAASLMRALEGLLAGVGVRVDAQAGGPRESLVTGLADIAVLGLREGGCGGGRDVVVMLPWVGAR